MAVAVKTIGILTSGGDAPGMNAAIRAVVRTALAQGLNVKGIYRGFSGLLDYGKYLDLMEKKEQVGLTPEEEEKALEYNTIKDLTAKDVADSIQRGGTILYTARCHRFRELEWQKYGADICRKVGIDGVVVIGGDGSFQGASRLSEQGINTIGLPGTIDLDISCTDYTIGFDTAINTALEAIDKVRDTSTSHERCSIIEVMGRSAGYIALWCGIASGAEEILTFEKKDELNEGEIIERIMKRKATGKKHHIIVNAEGIGDSYGLAERIEAATGVESRATIIGHIQRGGMPTCKDRVYASVMGSKAVDLLLEGKSNRVVAYKHGEYVDFDIQEALGMTKTLDPYMYEMAKQLSR